jgi:hypothetical protein
MKRALLAATAALLTNAIMTTPAFADVDLTPVNLTDATPQDVCDEALKPDENSGFMTEPTVTNDTGWVDDGAPVRGANVGDPVPTGTPTAGPIVFNGTYFRNGGSPNVWGGGNATLHFPNSTQEFETSQHQTDTITVSCRVWKFEGPDNDILVQPPGLQTTGNTSVSEQDVPGPDGFDTNNGPIDVEGADVTTLICISPNNVTKTKPGTWTTKHGFTGSCTDASTAAGTSFIPSGNAPTTDADTTYSAH